MYVPLTQVELAPYLTKTVPLKLQNAFSTAQVVHVGMGVGVRVGVGVGVAMAVAVEVGVKLEVAVAVCTP